MTLMLRVTNLLAKTDNKSAHKLFICLNTPTAKITLTNAISVCVADDNSACCNVCRIMMSRKGGNTSSDVESSFLSHMGFNSRDATTHEGCCLTTKQHAR